MLSSEADSHPTCGQLPPSLGVCLFVLSRSVLSGFVTNELALVPTEFHLVSKDLLSPAHLTILVIFCGFGLFPTCFHFQVLQTVSTSPKGLITICASLLWGNPGEPPELGQTGGGRAESVPRNGVGVEEGLVAGLGMFPLGGLRLELL